tara:strand:- start:439 stop:540 length:102 start_codon:yes stop_codon:yes gene_type:complete
MIKPDDLDGRERVTTVHTAADEELNVEFNTKPS